MLRDRLGRVDHDDARRRAVRLIEFLESGPPAHRGEDRLSGALHVDQRGRHRIDPQGVWIDGSRTRWRARRARRRTRRHIRPHDRGALGHLQHRELLGRGVGGHRPHLLAGHLGLPRRERHGDALLALVGGGELLVDRRQLGVLDRCREALRCWSGVDDPAIVVGEPRQQHRRHLHRRLRRRAGRGHRPGRGHRLGCGRRLWCRCRSHRRRLHRRERHRWGRHRCGCHRHERLHRHLCLHRRYLHRLTIRRTRRPA